MRVRGPCNRQWAPQNDPVRGLMTAQTDRGNRRGNSAHCLLNVSNEINNLGRQFGFHQPPSQAGAGRADLATAHVTEHAGADRCRPLSTCSSTAVGSAAGTTSASPTGAPSRTRTRPASAKSCAAWARPTSGGCSVAAAMSSSKSSASSTTSGSSSRFAPRGCADRSEPGRALDQS